MKCQICHKPISVEQQEYAQKIQIFDGEIFPVHSACIDVLIKECPQGDKEETEWFEELLKKFSN